MVVVGTIGPQFLQQRNQAAGQALQSQLEAGADANARFVQKSSHNIIQNAQNDVTRLAASVQRGQAIDMYV